MTRISKRELKVKIKDVRRSLYDPKNLKKRIESLAEEFKWIYKKAIGISKRELKDPPLGARHDPLR